MKLKIYKRLKLYIRWQKKENYQKPKEVLNDKASNTVKMT